MSFPIYQIQCVALRRNICNGVHTIKACRHQCVHENNLNLKDIFAKQTDLASKSFQERREWLAENISNASCNGYQTLSSGLPCKHELCKTCFFGYHGLHSSLFFRVKKQMEEGVRNFENRNNRKQRRQSASSIDPSAALTWLEAYAKRSGDYMPDKKEIHLPDYRWTFVHKKAIKSLGGRGPKYNWFRKQAKKLHPHIKIRKYKRFTKCTECSKLDEKLAKTTGATREMWAQKKEEHNAWQTRERDEYNKHREESTNEDTKHKSVCITIDGMDHSKTNCGALAREDKETEAASKLETHLTGVLAHGRNPGVLAYTWYDRFPSGSDGVTTILLDVITRIQETEGSLPPTLNLWLDNCWRENKNRCDSTHFSYQTLGYLHSGM